MSPLAKLLGGGVLSADEANALMAAMLDGTLGEDESEAALRAWFRRGETGAEIMGAAQAVWARRVPLGFDVGAPVIDTCGTGGDGAGTFNVSTAVALAAAASGCKVVKHGNRAQSSACGSADVLEALGFSLSPSPDEQAAELRARGFVFLFAPNHHPGLARVAPVRKRLGHRSIFNLLGPLLNPAAPMGQVVGVFSEAFVEPIAHALAALGRQRALVVSGGLGVAPTDEVTPWGQTAVAQVAGGKVSLRRYEGAASGPSPHVMGSDAQANAAIVRAVLAGTAHADAIELVALNLAAAWWVAGKGEVFEALLPEARRFLLSGAAAQIIATTAY